MISVTRNTVSVSYHVFYDVSCVLFFAFTGFVSILVTVSWSFFSSSFRFRFHSPASFFLLFYYLFVFVHISLAGRHLVDGNLDVSLPFPKRFVRFLYRFFIVSSPFVYRFRLRLFTGCITISFAFPLKQKKR